MVSRRGFSLVELLVVLSIIAILASFFAPVIRSAKAAVHQMSGGRTAKQLLMATSLYQADSDDVYPLAMFQSPDGLTTWFGHGTEGKFDEKAGLLAPYLKGKLGKDPTLMAEPYMGNEFGFGYNWGVIGSDMHLRGDYSQFPNCSNAAMQSQLSDPSNTAVFATTAFRKVSWLPDGDGRTYEFAFLDPPSTWHNNPNVDFRHYTTPVIDAANQRVIHKGRAVIGFADGNVRTLTIDQAQEAMFWRDAL